MQLFSELMLGLKVSIGIAFISLLIGLIPGALLFWGKTCKISIMNALATGIIELIKGVPILLLLSFFYFGGYNLNMSGNLSAIVVASVVLALIAMSEIASKGHVLAQILNIELNFRNSVKILFVTIVRESGRLINYTSLLSIIGINELLRTAKVISTSEHNSQVFIWAIGIYLCIHIIIKVIYSGLVKGLFSTEKTT
ncbi:MAG: hypothetical protein CVU84_08130 [Firmicutes bacterium HGW-Firmicutes-1]|jgi:polar amino acid transport system permease protein|nr:MAG: hypothetical protein CVU84_08130 [Firmicutes bacterium HGW-Firmicutes-1]